jgi:hypothetical protein
MRLEMRHTKPCTWPNAVFISGFHPHLRPGSNSLFCRCRETICEEWISVDNQDAWCQVIFFKEICRELSRFAVSKAKYVIGDRTRAKEMIDLRRRKRGLGSAVARYYHLCIFQRAHRRRHVGIAREIEIDLQPITDGAKPGIGRRYRNSRSGRIENHAGLRTNGVGQHNFLEKTKGEPADPQCKTRSVEAINSGFANCGIISL